MKDKMTRLEANRKIIGILASMVENQPDWRFHQILQNIDLNVRGLGPDQFYEESTETLERIKEYANC